MERAFKSIDKDKFLKEISESFLILNRSKSIHTDIPIILRKIGEATIVDRVYIFQNIENNCMKYIYEWNNEGIEPQINFEPLKKLPWSVFPELKEILKQNIPINDFVRNSENDWFRELMEEQNIISYLFVPIFVKNTFWGYVGFDNCSKNKLFNEGQISALRSLAEVMGNVLYTAELTKLKRKAEKREKKTLELFHLLSSNVEDIIFLLNKDLKITYSSPAFKNLINNYDEKEKSFTKLFNIKKDIFLKKINDKLITEKQTNNKKIYIEHIIKPLPNKSKAENRYLISSRDVSDREHLIKKIKLNLEKEKELNKLKSKFISMTSHELRTPLSTILSSVDLLEINSDSIENQTIKGNLIRHIRKIQIQINRLNKIISEVFILEKSSSENTEYRNELIDINEIIKKIIFNYFKDVSNELDLRLHQNPIKITTNKEWIINILRNVIENALKYGKSNIGKPVIETLETQDKIKITIKDYGIGIPKIDQPFIYESFFRSSNVLNQKGTGLGLAIVKELITKLKGDIKFESKEGNGTKFTIEIPKK